jgi:hypothetical protein
MAMAGAVLLNSSTDKLKKSAANKKVFFSIFIS